MLDRKETILIIHGMWGGPWIHENLRTYFKERGYEVVIPWLRHHDVDPKEPPHPDLGTLSLVDYADVARIKTVNPVCVGGAATL